MKPDPSAMQAALRKRAIELQKIIQQMKQDSLQTSTVYRNLEQELQDTRTQLNTPDNSRNNSR
jgi:hypothetical protein